MRRSDLTVNFAVCTIRDKSCFGSLFQKPENVVSSEYSKNTNTQYRQQSRNSDQFILTNQRKFFRDLKSFDRRVVGILVHF